MTVERALAGPEEKETFKVSDKLTFTKQVARDENEARSEIAVQILSKEEIGSGGFGKVYRTRVRSLTHENGGEGMFILKDFSKLGLNASRARRNAEEAKDTWRMLRDAGVRTWATYRVEKDRPIVLMGNGESDNSVVFCHHNESVSKSTLMQWGQFTFQNFESSIQDAIDDALKAGRRGIEVDGHAWMMRLVRRSDDEATLEYFIGDLDHGKTIEFPWNRATPTQNLETMRSSLVEELMRLPNITPAEFLRYRDIAIHKVEATQATLAKTRDN